LVVCVCRYVWGKTLMSWRMCTPPQKIHTNTVADCIRLVIEEGGVEERLHEFGVARGGADGGVCFVYILDTCKRECVCVSVYVCVVCIKRMVVMIGGGGGEIWGHVCIPHN
jgi:hypothetical protein